MAEKPAIGIVCLDTKFERIEGHIRNPATFSFATRHEVVQGATPRRLINQADPDLIEPFIKAARKLEREGMAAVAGSCGFLALFQQQIADAINVPFFSSSLLQLPMVHRLTPAGRKVGVVVADSTALTSRHLEAVGAEKVPVAVIGLEDQPEFREVILEGRRETLNADRLRQETLSQVQKLIDQNPDIGALVLECSDLPPFSASIQKQVRLPVFDAVTLMNTIYSAVAQTEYRQAAWGAS